MQPEQIPGTIFVVLTALVGLSLGANVGVLLLALGCAAGWKTYDERPAHKGPAFIAAMAFWAVGFITILATALRII